MADAVVPGLGRPLDGLKGLAEGREPLAPAALLLAFAAILATVSLAAVPLLLDYPNHLARYWLLAGGDHVAPVSSMYRIDWSRASTNIGLDLVAATLGRLVGYQAVGKLVAMVAVAGPPAGAVLLSRLIWRRWNWWQLSLPMLAWCTTALFGFLSFQAAVAAAAFSACLAVVLEGRPRLRFAAALACAAVVLLLHPFGLVFLGLLNVATAIGPAWRGLFEPARLVAIGRRAGVSAAAVLIPAGLLVAWAPTPPGAHMAGRPMFSWPAFDAYHAILTAASPLASYSLPVDAAFAAPLAGLVAWAAWRRRLAVHAGLAIVGVGAGLLALVMPWNVGDAGWVNLRLPLMTALMLFVSVAPDPLPSAQGRAVLAGLLLTLGLGKSAWINGVWRARQVDVRSIERALSQAPPGAAVFSVQVVPKSTRGAPLGRYLAGVPGNPTETTARHVVALAVPERRAFVATLFSVPGQQPLRVLPPWEAISVRSSWIPDAHVLDRPLTAEDLKYDPYLAVWRRRFDYVLVAGGDMTDGRGPFRPGPELQQVAGDGYATLYHIRR